MKVRYEEQQASQKREQLNKTFQWLKQIFSSLTFIEKWRYSRWAISRRDVYTKWPDTRLNWLGEICLETFLKFFLILMWLKMASHVTNRTRGITIVWKWAGKLLKHAKNLTKVEKIRPSQKIYAKVLKPGSWSAWP